MPATSRPSSGGDRRRHSSRFAACELRASVTEKTYEWMDKQAEDLGRSRSWHVGLVVEAFAMSAQQMTEFERTHLDALLRQPDALLAALRAAISSVTPTK